MTEYENEPFIVGDYQHNQIEFMHLYHKKWYTGTQFYAGRYERIFGYSAVSRPGKVFILGGCCDHSSTVSIFENDSWKKHGDLSNGRLNFMTMTYGVDVFIIGGTTYNKES